MVGGRAGRAVGAMVAAVAIVAVAGWLDGAALTGLSAIQWTPDSIASAPWFYSLVFPVPAAGVLAAGLLAWWADSLLTSVFFVLAGVLLTLLGVLDWVLVMKGVVEGTPPALSGPSADALHQLARWSAGAIGAPRIIGGGMMLAGLVPALRRLARRVDLRLSGNGRALVAIAAAALVVCAVSWPDGHLFWTGRDPASRLDFEAGLWRIVYDQLLAAAGVMVVGVLGCWTRSLRVGIVFATGGALLLFSGVMDTTLSDLPLLSQLGGAVDRFLLLNADHVWRTVGGGLFLTGLAAIGWSCATRAGTHAARHVVFGRQSVQP